MVSALFFARVLTQRRRDAKDARDARDARDGKDENGLLDWNRPDAAWVCGASLEFQRSMNLPLPDARASGAGTEFVRIHSACWEIGRARRSELSRSSTRR